MPVSVAGVQDVYVLLFSHVLPFYVVTTLVCFAMTVGPERGKARNYGLCLLWLWCCIESYIKIFGGDAAADAVSTFAGEVTVYRKLEYAQHLYHLALQALILWS